MKKEKKVEKLEDTMPEISTGNPDSLMAVFEVEGSPFTVVKNDEKYFLALGKYKISEVYGSADECVALTESTSWDMIMQIMYIVAKDTIDKQIEVEKVESPQLESK